MQQTKKKIPLLGDIPLLGYLFRSKSLNKNKTELLVITTPVLTQPLEADKTPPLPHFDMSFELEKEKPKTPQAPDPAEPREGSPP